MHEISSKTARIMQLEEEIKKKEKEFDHLFSKKRYLMLTLKIICPVCFICFLIIIYFFLFEKIVTSALA